MSFFSAMRLITDITREFFLRHPRVVYLRRRDFSLRVASGTVRGRIDPGVAKVANGISCDRTLNTPCQCPVEFGPPFSTAPKMKRVNEFGLFAHEADAREYCLQYANRNVPEHSRSDLHRPSPTKPNPQAQPCHAPDPPRSKTAGCSS